MTPGTLSLASTLPNPVGLNPFELPNSPASSRNGSTLAKFGWLNTFNRVAWNSNPARSLNLNRLNSEKLAVFVIASCTGFRGVLPNGVPNTDCAVLAFRMNRTWLFVTVWILHVGLAFVSARQ